MCYDYDARPPIAPIAGGASGAGDVVLTSADGTTFRAYAARAAQPSGAGIVILPDVRGLHPFYEELAVRFAENGIDAIAIDYFGRTAGTSARGDDFEWMPHMEKTTPEGRTNDVTAAVAYLRSAEGGAPRSIFTVGFCFGGALSWIQAANGHNFAGSIGFYGNPTSPPMAWYPKVGERITEMNNPLLGLFGGADQSIPASAVQSYDHALKAANVAHEFHSYANAPHSFFDRRQTDFASESADAWAKILDFIQRNTAR